MVKVTTSSILLSNLVDNYLPTRAPYKLILLLLQCFQSYLLAFAIPFCYMYMYHSSLCQCCGYVRPRCSRREGDSPQGDSGRGSPWTGLCTEDLCYSKDRGSCQHARGKGPTAARSEISSKILNLHVGESSSACSDTCINHVWLCWKAHYHDKYYVRLISVSPHNLLFET